MIKTNSKTLVMTALMAAVLVGCGGGSGGGSDTDTTTPVNPGASDLQTSVPAPTYAAGSQELEAWNVLNQAREACGFGLLKQDARLDASAKAHVNYLNLNNLVDHVEVPGKPGFTGATPTDRAQLQGFTGAVGESIYSGRNAASEAMSGLLTVPYHLLGSLWAWRSAGLEFDNKILTINFGTENATPQRLGTGTVANYPCEGAKNVGVLWVAETPNPFPDIASSIKGAPVALLADPGSTLIVNNFSIIRVSTGQSESYRTLTVDNDVNKRLGSNEFVAVPIAALAYDEAYQVSYSGTLNGSAISKTFTFKTMPKPRSIVTCRNPQTGEIYQCYEDTMERV